MQKTWVQSLGQEDPLEKGLTTCSNILAGEFHGQRSLVDLSPWGGKESDAVERLTLFTFTLGQPELYTKHNSSAIRLFLQLPHCNPTLPLDTYTNKIILFSYIKPFPFYTAPAFTKTVLHFTVPLPRSDPYPHHFLALLPFHQKKKKITQASSQEKLLNPVLCNFTAHLL